MTLCDLFILIFFATVFYKCISDAFDFWREFDAEGSCRNVRHASVAPRHLPAPSRPSPSNVPLRAGPAAAAAGAAAPRLTSSGPFRKAA